MPNLQLILRRVDEAIRASIPGLNYAGKYKRAFYGLPELGGSSKSRPTTSPSTSWFLGGANFDRAPPLGNTGDTRYLKITVEAEVTQPEVLHWINKRDVRPVGSDPAARHGVPAHRHRTAAASSPASTQRVLGEMRFSGYWHRATATRPRHRGRRVLHRNRRPCRCASVRKRAQDRCEVVRYGRVNRGRPLAGGALHQATRPSSSVRVSGSSRPRARQSPSSQCRR